MTMNKKNLDIVIVSSEVVPFAKTGGLADVCGALPIELTKMGHKLRVFMPRYREISNALYNLELKHFIGINIDGSNYKVKLYQYKYKNVDFYFVDYPQFFGREGLYNDNTGKEYADNILRFTLFNRVVHAYLKHDKNKTAPDIIHCNDWQTSILTLYLRHKAYSGDYFDKTGIIYSIHNLAYQGIFPSTEWKVLKLENSYFTPTYLEYYNKINLKKAGILFSDIISTVSENYAKEILTNEYGFGLNGNLYDRKEDLYGIVNGVDYDDWNPEIKNEDYNYKITYNKNEFYEKIKIKKLFQKEIDFKVKENIPLIGMITRIVDQKGFDILIDAYKEILDLPLQIVILGTGQDSYVQKLNKIEKEYPDKFKFFNKFDNALAHRIESASDFYLMPSKYEPCGLNQLYSLKYGTLPIVRAIGGLKDTVKNDVTGFSFEDYSSSELYQTIKKAIKVFSDKKKMQTMITSAMNEDWSWNKSAKEYENIYRKALQKRSQK